MHQFRPFQTNRPRCQKITLKIILSSTENTPRQAGFLWPEIQDQKTKIRFASRFHKRFIKGLLHLHRCRLIGNPWDSPVTTLTRTALPAPTFKITHFFAPTRDVSLFALVLACEVVLQCPTGRQAIREWSEYTGYPLFLAALWYGFTASKLILFTEEVLTQSKSKKRDSRTPQEWSGFPTNEGR